MLHKVTFYGSIGVIYLLTIGVIGAVVSTPHLSKSSAAPSETPKVATVLPSPTPINIISGEPVRLVIAAANIDLPVAKGTYDQQSKSWTLSNDKAHFAVMTEQPNNLAGTTFIYGHGTGGVFGKIGNNRPPTGTIAQIYTKNKHIFLYKLSEVTDRKPSETNILQNTHKGEPRLIIQTCTGIFSEWRTMFIFTLEGVV